jgi:hypothetical protein
MHRDSMRESVIRWLMDELHSVLAGRAPGELSVHEFELFRALMAQIDTLIAEVDAR